MLQDTSIPSEIRYADTSYISRGKEDKALAFCAFAYQLISQQLYCFSAFAYSRELIPDSCFFLRQTHVVLPFSATFKPIILITRDKTCYVRQEFNRDYLSISKNQPISLGGEHHDKTGLQKKTPKIIYQPG